MTFSKAMKYSLAAATSAVGALVYFFIATKEDDERQEAVAVEESPDYMSVSDDDVDIPSRAASCSICLQHMIDGEEELTTFMGALFHEECIREWFNERRRAVGLDVHENRRQKKRRSVGEMIFDMFISGYFSYIS